MTSAKDMDLKTCLLFLFLFLFYLTFSLVLFFSFLILFFLYASSSLFSAGSKGVLEQDMVSFRARLDDHHVLLTNQSAGAYYVGVYNNDNYMKVRRRAATPRFNMSRLTSACW